MPSAPVTANATPSRILSLDAFRGLTMILMLSEGLGLSHLGAGSWFEAIGRQFDHEPWHGMRLWDMIQPAFMFIVGAAMPFSFAQRPQGRWGHVLKRAFLLVLWGVIARIVQRGSLYVDLINVLAQIAFTYTLAYCVLGRGWKAQCGLGAGLLALHTALYISHNSAAPWTRDANFGWWLDGVLLGTHWGGGYATVNCLSSAANTIAGLWAGSNLSDRRRLLLTGIAAIALGLALSPFIPVNKKIWTASFACVSLGLTLLLLVLFQWLVDNGRWKLGLPIVFAVGSNSILIYLLHEMLHRWANQSIRIFLAPLLSGDLLRVATLVATLAIEVWICWVFYRRRVFFKL
jgi:predicted acyltransferase